LQSERRGAERFAREISEGISDHKEKAEEPFIEVGRELSVTTSERN
jgi:hypothetical protein